MTRNQFRLLVLLHVAALAAFPVWQALQTGGVVFFANAIDESGYLQYHTAKLTTELSFFGRTSSYLVVIGHELGLSGGWLNLIFDCFSVAGVLVLSRALFARLGLPRPELAALCVVDLPLLLLNCNPIVDWFFDFSLQRGGMAWLAMPWSTSPPVVRSPEPQLSFVLLIIAGLLCSRLRSLVPVYCVLPFLYYFITIPTAIVVLAIQLRRGWRQYAMSTPFALLSAFLCVAGALWCYQNFVMDDYIKENYLESRLPLVSFSGLFALGVYCLEYSALAPKFRLPLLAVALGSTLAENLQLVTGSILFPNNIEQYFGVSAVAVVVACSAAQRANQRLLSAVCIGLFLAWSSLSFLANNRLFMRIPFSAELREALQRHPERVAVNDVAAATRLDMAFPRQDFTALSFYKRWTRREQSLPAYACVRGYLLSDQNLAAKFRVPLAELDAGYISTPGHYPLFNLTRIAPPPDRTIDFTPSKCGDPPLVVFMRQ